MDGARAAQEQGLPTTGGPTGPASVVREGVAMGTVLRVEVRGDSGRIPALAASEAVFREVERVEALLSTWRPESPLSRLNRAPVGLAQPVPHEIRGLLERALAASRATGGAFDPRVGALVDAWDLRGAGRAPTSRELASALGAAGAKGITLGADGFVRHVDAAWMDAGGFGKGAALAGAADSLRALGVAAARVSLGGQLLLLGAPRGDERGWTVGVSHPSRRQEPVAELRIRDASVATSGTSERGVTVDGHRMGHLLDPRTGEPSPAWGSVTVVSPDPLEADILSTALYVLGPDAGMAWARDLQDVGVLFLILDDGSLKSLWNPAMERWLPAPIPAPGAGLLSTRTNGRDP